MAKEVKVAKERHVFRSLIKLAVFLGLATAVARFIARKKDEYAGLTESEARAKFVDKVGPKLGDEAAEDIADQVIPKLREKGLIKADPGDDPDSDPVADAVDSVVED